MQWICVYAGQNDNIYFITSKNSERDFLKYYKFFEFINKEFKIKDFIDFKDAIDKFKVVIIYEDSTWEIIHEETEQASFQQLYELNVENQDKNKETKFDKTLQNAKIKLNSIFDIRKKQVLKNIKR